MALVALGFTWGRDNPGWVVGVVAVLLAGAVLAAVHHAEVVAHRVGEPMGALVLAVAVTVIEVALIITLMVSSEGTKGASLARDTVFAAVMITCNGIVGMCLMVGALRGGVARFNPEGAGAELATVATLAGLSLVLPTFTTSSPGPKFSGQQLVFAAIASALVYGLFVATQTIRHREDFLPVTSAGEPVDEEHGTRPEAGEAWFSLGLLGLALVSVVGLAKVISPTLESGVESAGLPEAVVGVVIALLVLLPESIAAYRAALRDRVQTGLNLALGSAIASMGLTIPAVAVASIWISGPLLLGLGATHMVLLALTVAVGILTVVPGKATPLQAGMHLVLLAAYVDLAINP
ncbi:calcium:proton antiporter [Yinghuangia seranimata]|uniref:calcium:proton antiporter n=1 Tax=Yinghuangia seranimata TaxID=408067 RepID=UPI00248C29DE|nr:ionic transporter y4hA [Yinghuangia seranimata]MDI2129928.1 ionic transporter y4hA [Yinghuangia seranimata]